MSGLSTQSEIMLKSLIRLYREDAMYYDEFQRRMGAERVIALNRCRRSTNGSYRSSGAERTHI